MKIKCQSGAGARKTQSVIALLLLVMFNSCSRSAEASFRRAVEARVAGNYQLAAEEYEHYIQSNPTGERQLEARLQLANIYYLNLHRYDRARALYKEFLGQAPAHPEANAARERLAEVLVELGRSYEAIAELENINPQDENTRRRVRLRIADLYADQRDYNQALTEYAKVTDSADYDELSEQAYLREAAIYHLARHQYEQALPIYQKIASHSSDADVRRRALYAVADCYAGLFRFEEAIKALREIKDEKEQDYIARRVAELEQQRRDAARVPQTQRRPRRLVAPNLSSGSVRAQISNPRWSRSESSGKSNANKPRKQAAAHQQ
jgi:tetratricopeptide (TPR) repeat protein